MKRSPLIFLIFMSCIYLENCEEHIGRPIFEDRPCNGTEDIITKFEPGLQDGYQIIVKKELAANTKIFLKFDSEAKISFRNDENIKQVSMQDNVYRIVLKEATNNFNFYAKGTIVYLPPYIVSFKINKVEYCTEPNLGYFEDHPAGAVARPDVPDRFCGRRKVYHRGLIVNGKVSIPGAWPWHAAINRISKRTLKYICGGTIIAPHFVLTAAHCASISGISVLPETLGVSLGRHKLIGGDTQPIEKEVYDVIIHDNFNHKTLDNDIALLKLETAIKYNEYIQPACLWFDKVKEKLPTGQLFGTVTGWGFDQTESISPYLNEITLPLVDDLTCIRSKPQFFATILDGNKFCVGYRNGSSACNGDSGGGYHVYVPYFANDEYHRIPDGAWYVRGIVSLSVAKDETAVCDPYEYTVFTDTAPYMEWIRENIE